MSFWILLAELTDDEYDFVTTLYEKYKHYMYLEALRILRNGEDAEEAVNDAMCSIIRHLSKFEGNTDAEIRNKIRLGIKTTVQRKAIDHYNVKKKRMEHEQSLYYEFEKDDEHPEIPIEDEKQDVQKIIVNEENARLVRMALLELSPDLQDAVNLVYMSGFSGVDAANYLGISDVALRAWLFKARKKLRMKLEKDFEEYAKVR